MNNPEATGPTDTTPATNTARGTNEAGHPSAANAGEDITAATASAPAIGESAVVGVSGLGESAGAGAVGESTVAGVGVGGAGGGEAAVAGGVGQSGKAESGGRYLVPRRRDAVFNGVVAFLTRRGVSVWGSRVLHVRGRKSGDWRTVPVNLLTIDGERYLVAPRGQTQWVRNLRAAGHGELHVGRRVERFVPTELADDVKPAVLRAYLRRWKFEVGVFFDGVDADASDADLLRIAPGYPVFRVTMDHDRAVD
jgi:deazaflavin-dependent oxidoreductase (nitroreductase family)